MGLAASQARLLTLTSRMNDLERNVMRLSAQKMMYSIESMNVAATYNQEMEVAEAIKGEQVVTGYTPIQKTRTVDGPSISVTGRTLKQNGYDIIINNSGVGNVGNVGSFDINTFDYDKHINLVPGQTFNPSMYNQKAAEFINTYGSANFRGLSQSDTVKLVKSCDYAKALGLTEQQYYQVQNIYNSALMHNPLNEHGDPGTLMNEVGANASQTPGLDPSKACKLSELWWKADKGWNIGISVNEKNVDSDTWNTALDTTAKTSGLDVDLFKQAVRNGGSITAEEMQRLKGKYTVDYISGQTYTGYEAAKNAAKSQYQLSPEYQDYLANSGSQGGSGNGTLTQSQIDNMTGAELQVLILSGDITLKYYGQEVDEVPATIQGESTTEYYTEDKPIYGTDYTKRDAAKRAAQTKYDRALANISKKEKMTDMEMTQSNTELSACNKEYDSVKSLIEKNVEQGFKLFS